MKLRIFLSLTLLFNALTTFSQDRFWVHKAVYENHFSSAAELSEWGLVEDNGTGGFTLSGTGVAVLKMDDASGNFANRIFSVNGGAIRYQPLDSINGRLEVNILKTTGGNQRFFVQAQTYSATNNLISQITILPATVGSGFFTINMRGLPWPSNADKVRFIIGGENYSGLQGTIEFDYLSYSNTSGAWSNGANWSATSGGPGGASVPGSDNPAIFDGAASSNGSCQLDAAAAVNALDIRAGYSGNVDLQGAPLTVGKSGITMNGGGLTCGSSLLAVNGGITISGGTFKSSTNTIALGGNLVVSGGQANLNQGTLVLNTLNDQLFTVSPSVFLHRVIVNKPGSQMVLGSDLMVQDTLELLNGIINTGNYAVQLGSAAASPGLIGNGGGGKVNGSIRKWITGTGAIRFPFGGSAFDAPLSLNVVSAPAAAGILTLSYADSANSSLPVNFTDGSVTISSRSRSGWKMTASGISGGNYNLAVSSSSLGFNGALSDLHLVLAGGVVGSHVTATGPLSNPTLLRTNLNAAALSNTFYAGMTLSALPVKWISFTGIRQADQTTRLSWKVAAHTAVSFEVQRSHDGNHYQPIAFLPAASREQYEYTDADITGGGYYRVKSLDVDQKPGFSPVVFAGEPSKNTWLVKQTVIRNAIEVQFTSFNHTTKLILRDMQGRQLATIQVSQPAIIIPAVDLSKGIYLLQLSHNGRTYVSRLVKP